jgi:hypothetical protein
MSVYDSNKGCQIQERKCPPGQGESVGGFRKYSPYN